MKQDAPVNLREALPGTRTDDSSSAQEVPLASESFVLELLRTHAEAQGRLFRSDVRLVGGEGPVALDAVAPSGLDELPGPLAFEIRLTAGTPAFVVAKAGLDHIALAGNLTRIENAVIIVGQDLLPDELGRLQSLAGVSVPRIRVWFWGPGEFKRIIDLYPDTTRLLLKNLPNADTAKAVQRAATGQDEDWREHARGLLEDLHRAWRNDDLVLFLGAGVSIDAGIPSWNGLLNQLLVAMVEKMGDGGSVIPEVSAEERRIIAQRLQRLQESSPLLAARYLRSGLDERFVYALRKALYSSLKSNSAAQLGSLARLCMPRRNGSGVHTVVSYNFDDLLERQLAEKGVEHKPIFKRGTRIHPECLAVYHVHGFLPQHPVDEEDSAENLVVFSEEGYHLLYNNPYSWSNIVQLSLMSEHTCVFIGLSMSDPNLRRLLEIAAKNGEKPRHVVLLKRFTMEKLVVDGPDEREGKLKQSMDPHLARGVLEAHHRLIEKSVAELGVRVAWFEEFEEIAGMIDRIRQGGE